MKIELYHDFLAKKLFAKASAEEKISLKIERLLVERYRFYQEKEVLLNKDDLDYITPYLDTIDLSQDQQAFIQLSRRQLKRARRWRRGGVTVVILLLSILLAMAIHQRNVAENSVQAQTSMRLALEGSVRLDQGKPSEAFRLVQAAAATTADSATLGVVYDVLADLMNDQLWCDVVHGADIVVADLDSDYILTGAADGSVKLWSTDCQPIDSFQHAMRVTAATFSPDGQYALTASYDSTVVVWNLATGSKQVIRHPSPVQLACFSFSYYGQWIVTGGLDYTVRVYQLNGQAIPTKTLPMGDTLLTATVSPSGQYLLAANADSIVLKTLDDPQSTFVFTIPVAQKIVKVDFIQSDPSRNRLLLRTLAGTKVIDRRGSANLPGSYHYLNQYLQDKRVEDFVFATSGQDKPAILFQVDRFTVAKWTLDRRDMASYQPVVNAEYNISSHLAFTCFGLSPSNVILFTATDNQRLQLRRAHDGTIQREIKCAVAVAEFSSDDQLLLTLDGSETAHIWTYEDAYPFARDDYRAALDFFNGRLKPVDITKARYDLN